MQLPADSKKPRLGSPVLTPPAQSVAKPGGGCCTLCELDPSAGTVCSSRVALSLPVRTVLPSLHSAIYQCHEFSQHAQEARAAGREGIRGPGWSGPKVAQIQDLALAVALSVLQEGPQPLAKEMRASFNGWEELLGQGSRGHMPLSFLGWPWLQSGQAAGTKEPGWQLLP